MNPTLHAQILTLRKYQAWRTGEDERTMDEAGIVPREITAALNAVIEVAERHLRDATKKVEAEPAGPAKCDGNHAGPNCSDPKCWNDGSGPVAWAAFSENGNIRIWTADHEQAKRISTQIGQALVPLAVCGSANERSAAQPQQGQMSGLDYDCHRCFREIGRGVSLMTKMILCPSCGNKRCPKASDHRLDCTGSNEPGQQGSIYQ